MKDIALHVLDLVQNSVSANANLIEINIEEKPDQNLYILTIKDNGKGMSPELLAKVKDPYTTTRTTRKVGLGIPLLAQNAEMAGGSLEIKSTLGVGTQLCAKFQMDHIDRVPIGDIAGVIVMSVCMNPNLDFIYSHLTQKGEYIFDTREVKAVLEGVSINEIAIQKYLKELIEESLKEIEYTR
ncbi:MAG: ATP-binding protein [Bacteroidales bacterium]